MPKDFPLLVPTSSQGEWTAKRFYGDPKLAAAYLPVAYALLGMVKQRMALGGVGYGAQMLELPDGTLIRVLRNGEQNIVEIDVISGSGFVLREYRTINGYCFYPRNKGFPHGWIILDGQLIENDEYPFDYSPDYTYPVMGLLTHFQDRFKVKHTSGEVVGRDKTAKLGVGLGNALFSGNQFAFDPDNNDVYSVVHSPHGDLGLAIELIIPGLIEYNTKRNLAVIFPPGGKESFYMPYLKFDQLEGRWRIVMWVFTEYNDPERPEIKTAITLAPTPAILYKNGKKFLELPTDVYFPLGVGFFKDTIGGTEIKTPIMVCSIDLRGSIIFVFGYTQQLVVGLEMSAKLAINHPVKFSPDGTKACLIVHTEDFVAMFEFAIRCTLADDGNPEFTVEKNHTEYTLRQWGVDYYRETGVPDGVNTAYFIPVSWLQPYGVGWQPPIFPDGLRTWKTTYSKKGDNYLSGEYPMAATYDANGVLQIAMVKVEKDNVGFVYDEGEHSHANNSFGFLYKWDAYAYFVSSEQDREVNWHDGAKQYQYLALKTKTIPLYDYQRDSITKDNQHISWSEWPPDRWNLVDVYYQYTFNEVQKATYLEYLDINNEIVLRATVTNTKTSGRTVVGEYGSYVDNSIPAWVYKDDRVETVMPEETQRSIEVILESTDFETIQFTVGT